MQRSSLKFKGWVLDQVIAQIVGDEEFVHVVGFEAGEDRRMLRDMPLGPGVESKTSKNGAACLDSTFTKAIVAP
ncbi:hypothetical protein [Nonomuraea sp. NPDC049028]|uniref:hypothetical protein n=1 Tax=Nonomuraea sp. NPDC049028 TaxID=3364348 RepID=UPI00371FA3F7